eukprot:TRINITY_DN23882_c0_g1_i1.p1 TRINITY_DN23882_c0_g1~~TRINITY_DN23882_c0_g1_i1.p1  ORF type:complete len:658 (-),score=108.09 TRINITY_DN23882_c0_g1_i1:218-2191(-)
MAASRAAWVAFIALGVAAVVGSDADGGAYEEAASSGGASRSCEHQEYQDFLEILQEARGNLCPDGWPERGTVCLPTAVSHYLVGRASDLLDAEESLATDASLPLWANAACPSILLVALVAFAWPLAHTERGRWAAMNAVNLVGSRDCWPLLGFGNPNDAIGKGAAPTHLSLLSYREVLEVILYAEAWQDHGSEAEHTRFARRDMPRPLLNTLTTPSLPLFGGEGTRSSESSRSGSRLVRILSTGHHASYPAAVFSMWQALLGDDYEIELKDYSFDNRYCKLAGSCSLDERFAWLGDHLRGTVVESCNGLFLKGFENMPDLAEKLYELLDSGRTGSLLSEVDMLLCTHPPYSCRLFWPMVLRLGKPLLGFFGGTLEAHVPGSDIDAWLRDFRAMARHPRVQFAAIAPFLAEKIRYQTGVDVPAARGYGFHVVSQGVTYYPSRPREVLVWKNSNECDGNRAAFDDLLATLLADAAGSAGAGEAALRFRHLQELREAGDSSYATLMTFRSVVFMPYEVLVMTFYEFYHVGIPLFIPTAEFAAFFMYRGPVTYPHCNRVLRDLEDPTEEELLLESGGRSRPPYSPFERNRLTERLAWLEAYTDWYRFPHLQRYATLPELALGLYALNPQAVSAGMRQDTERSLAASSQFWRQAFAKVLDAS